MQHDAFRISIATCGAIGDGATLATAAIQDALDQAGEAGGGTVFVPPGTWLTGTVFLRSGTTLELHPAARILGSPDLAAYTQRSWGQHIDRTPWHLIAVCGVRDVRITGGGTIDGNGPAFWEPCVDDPARRDPERVPPGAYGGLDPITCVPERHAGTPQATLAWIRANKERRPSPMIEITECENVRIDNVHITNSAGWLLHLHNSHRLWITGVRLSANLMGPNNDGFDITGCQDVLVSDCHLSCCDDAICVKTTPDSQPIERVTVTNCVIRTRCVALKFGCAETFHDFKQVTFSNCVVYESSRAVGIYTKRGGNIDDVTISNIVCDTRNPFVMNRPIHIQARVPPTEDGVAPGRIRNVIIQGVVCRTDGRMLLSAEQQGQIDGVVIRDLQVELPMLDDPALLADRVSCGQLPHEHPDVVAARAVVVAKNIDRLVLDNLMVRWPQTDSAGRMVVPADWSFPLKACNGMFDAFFARGEFATGALPPFALTWARGVRGGYLSAPTAVPAPGAPAHDHAQCDWPMRD
ncbi:MAG: glycoside hydrolase family 28 protein [Planctomycetota bacterium]